METGDVFSLSRSHKMFKIESFSSTLLQNAEIQIFHNNLIFLCQVNPLPSGRYGLRGVSLASLFHVTGDNREHGHDNHHHCNCFEDHDDGHKNVSELYDQSIFKGGYSPGVWQNPEMFEVKRFQ